MLNNDQARPDCYNNRTPPSAGYWAQSRSYPPHGGPYMMVDEFIPFRLKVGCGQDSSHLPCKGCKHLGEEL